MLAIIGLVTILTAVTAAAIAVGSAILYKMRTDDEIRKQLENPWEK